MARSVDLAPGVALAIEEVSKTYNDNVSANEKAKTLLKFGRTENLGTSLETVWETGGNETYVTTNAIDYAVSSSASDTATVMRIEGHTVSGTGSDAQFSFVVQDVTLNGQTKVALATPLARVSRAYVDSGTLAGDLAVFEDDTLTGGVPDTQSKIHIQVLGSQGQTQTFKAATTFSNTDYAFITAFYAAVTKKTAATVNFVIEVREPGGVFRPAAGRITLASAGQSTFTHAFYPHLIVPKNCDLRVRAEASTTGVEVDASIQAILATVT